MNNTEQFASLSLEDMLEAVTQKLEQSRKSEEKEANRRLDELDAKKIALQAERNKLVVQAAFDYVSNIKMEDIDSSNILYSDYESTLTMSITFPEPEGVTKLDDQISEINGEISRVKTQAALDINRETSSSKELDLIYLARRMKVSPEWRAETPVAPMLPPFKISRNR